MDQKWLAIARTLMGQKEIPGPRDNPTILDFFLHTTYHAKHDEVPWCAAFICYCLEKAGFTSTKSAAALSYSRYGIPCKLQPGAIVVFRWHSGGEHVSFVDHVVDEHTVACLGGNQSDQVKISQFPRASIVAIRWPAGASVPA